VSDEQRGDEQRDGDAAAADDVLSGAALGAGGPADAPAPDETFPERVDAALTSEDVPAEPLPATDIELGGPVPRAGGERTVVHVMRHGEVENPEGVLYGRLPGYHLSELGRKMAERVADQLAGRDVTHVVASPLERAQETAAPIARLHGLSVATDGRLIEADNVFQGRTFGVGDGALRRPGNWRHLRNPFRPSWGEPYVDQAVRMTAALHAARDAARGHEAVCVSHQLPIWILRCYVERRRLWHDPRSRQCTLASLTSFTFEGDELVAVTYTEPALDLVPPHLRAGARPKKGTKGFGA
jgi:broad specificity phosphatase PhoE